MRSIAPAVAFLLAFFALGPRAQAERPAVASATPADPGVVLKTRAHYYALGAALGFQRIYIQSESRLGGRHGLGLSADITWSGASDDVWGAGSTAEGGAVGLNYRYVFDDAYFADGVYAHVSTVLRRLNIDYALDDHDAPGTVRSLALNGFVNAGYQWYLFGDRVQLAVGFGIDVAVIFDPTVALPDGGTMPMERIEGAPGRLLAVPDIDFTLGYAF